MLEAGTNERTHLTEEDARQRSTPGASCRARLLMLKLGCHPDFFFNATLGHYGRVAARTSELTLVCSQNSVMFPESTTSTFGRQSRYAPLRGALCGNVFC